MYLKKTIIAIANQKGGVGKTSTATNLATALAKSGNKTLIIDLDPQANTTSTFDILNKKLFGIYDALLGKKDIKEVIYNTSTDNLDIVTANLDLAAAEIELISLPKREYLLSNLLSPINIYNYVIIDCPPSLGILTINALTAANNLIVPMQCEFYSLEGLTKLLGTVSIIQKNLNKNLFISGILFTMYDKRTKLTDEVEKDVRHCLGNMVFKTTIPRNIRVSEAPSHGKTVIDFDIKCQGAQKYIEFMNELITEERLKCQVIEA